MTWQASNQEEFPVANIRVESLQLDFNKKKSFLNRLIQSFHGLRDFNFCRPSGQETQHIYDCMKRIKPDVVLCHFGYTALRILPVTNALKLPLVVHFHGRDISASLKNKWYRWSLKKSIKHFSAAVVVGNHQRRKLIEEYFMRDDKVFLIPCGVPTEQFSSVRKKNSCPLKFISVSRISQEKGLDYSLRAFAEIADKIPDSHFTIIGEGPLKVELESSVQNLGLKGRVSFVGGKNPVEIIEHLRTSDVFLQHSLQSQNGWIEGFGVSIAEASSMKLPVVVTDCGGIVDQVIDGVTGYVVAQRDIMAMAARMKELAIDADLREKMGNAGRNRMVEHFDTQKQILKLEMVLEEFAN
jgi:glycosyltransferase involved in cell wall biosynthesis